MMNSISLTGRLTRNMALRYTKTGTPVGNFTLAVDRNFTDRNGNRGTDFIRCTIWRKPAETFANFTTKGSLVGVHGRISTGSYQNQSGQVVYTVGVTVSDFTFLDSRQQSQQLMNRNNNAGPSMTPEPNAFNPFANGQNPNQNKGMNNNNNGPLNPNMPSSPMANNPSPRMPNNPNPRVKSNAGQTNPPHNKVTSGNKNNGNNNHSSSKKNQNSEPGININDHDLPF